MAEKQDSGDEVGRERRPEATINIGHYRDNDKQDGQR